MNPIKPLSLLLLLISTSILGQLRCYVFNIPNKVDKFAKLVANVKDSAATRMAPTLKKPSEKRVKKFIEYCFSEIALEYRERNIPDTMQLKTNYSMLKTCLTKFSNQKCQDWFENNFGITKARIKSLLDQTDSILCARRVKHDTASNNNVSKTKKGSPKVPPKTLVETGDYVCLLHPSLISVAIGVDSIPLGLSLRQNPKNPIERMEDIEIQIAHSHIQDTSEYPIKYNGLFTVQCLSPDSDAVIPFFVLVRKSGYQKNKTYLFDVLFYSQKILLRKFHLTIHDKEARIY